MVSEGVYDSPQLTQTDLKLLYPPDNLYGNHLTLAVHLTASLLVEKMEWEGDTAVGETAFWLKVLSVPAIKDHQIDKIRFKRRVFSAWKNGSGDKNDQNASISHDIRDTPISLGTPDTDSTSKVVATPQPGKRPPGRPPKVMTYNTIPPRSETPADTRPPTGQTPAVTSVSKRMYDTDEQVPAKRPKTIFEVRSPQKNTEPKKAVHNKTSIYSEISTDYGEIPEEDDNSIHEVLNDTTGLTAEEWAILEASITAAADAAAADTGQVSHETSSMVKSPAEISAETSLLLNISNPALPNQTDKRTDKARLRNVVVKENNVTLIAEPTDAAAARYIQCTHCAYKAFNRQDLDRHKFKDHADDIYVIPCAVEGCEYRAKQNWVLQRHMISRHSVEKNFKCDHCDYTAKTFNEIKRHTMARHEKVKWSCDLCDYQCGKTDHISQSWHLARAHQDYSRVHKCPYNGCDFFDKSRAVLGGHINEVHVKGVKFTCGIGDCTFRSLSEVKVKSHRYYGHALSSPLPNKPSSNPQRYSKIGVVDRYYCSECRIPFRFIQLVERHIQKYHYGTGAEPVPTNATEPGIMSHTCSQCQQTFEDYDLALKHIKDSHDGTGTAESEFITDPNYSQRYIRCSFCDFTTTCWAGMKSHVRAQHERKLYACPHCDYITKAKNGYTNHIRLLHDPNNPKVDKTKQKEQVTPADDENLIRRIEETIDSVVADAATTVDSVVADAAADIYHADINELPVTLESV